VFESARSVEFAVEQGRRVGGSALDVRGMITLKLKTADFRLRTRSRRLRPSWQKRCFAPLLPFSPTKSTAQPGFG
jgi:hypothetical protein